MPLILAVLFMLGFVALGARPYRAKPTLPTSETNLTYRSGAELGLYASDVIEKVKTATRVIWNFRPIKRAPRASEYYTPDQVISTYKSGRLLSVVGATSNHQHEHQWITEVQTGVVQQRCVECNGVIRRF